MLVPPQVVQVGVLVREVVGVVARIEWLAAGLVDDLGVRLLPQNL